MKVNESKCYQVGKRQIVMRVLHIGKYFSPFSGGIENFMGDMLPALIESGVSIAVVLHNHDFSFRKILKERYKGILLYRVPCHGTLLYAPLSPLFPFVLNQVIHEFRPDIIHAHMPNTSCFSTLFLPAAKKIPMIIHWHADVVQSKLDAGLRYAYQLYRPFEQKLLKKADRVIATSPLYLKTSSALYNWNYKTSVVPLGLKPRRDYHASEKNKLWAEQVWGKDRTRMLAIGRLTYYKGHDTLIKAASRVPGARVVIVGRGELMKKLKKTVSDYCIDDRITIIGYLEDDKLNALLYSSDCLILPSIERTEAFGLVLLEAMRAGKPSIICNVKGSGMGWVVKDKITGLHVPPQDTYSLSETMKIIDSNPDLRIKMGIHALERFNRYFQIDRIARLIIDIYKEYC